MNAQPAIGFVLLLASAVLLLAAAARLSRARARRRLFDGAEAKAASSSRVRGLARWLAVAGFRRGDAPALFVAATAGAVCLAGVAASVWLGTGMGAYLASGLGFVPGPAGALLALIIEGAPALMLLGLAAAPWLFVRGARRARREAIEQDLPTNLELLATLSEAGFGFDAAIDRLLDSQPPRRPLVGEFRLYQRDARAGMPRSAALRRLAERTDVPAMTVLTSALMQAEQVGASISGVLRTQADDLRNLRRERALAQAEALEVKLVFPLVICFLPGLFVAAAGPAFYQFVQLIDRILRSGI